MNQKTPILTLSLALVGLLGAPACHAVLTVGAEAPDFVATAVQGGAPFDFHLTKALKKGPVVLYFYPKAFASQCTIEARAFSQAAAQFKSLGATVIGVSSDNLETLKVFSKTECHSKFPVAADTKAQVMQRYEALQGQTGRVAERISYVISPERKVVHVFADPAGDGHADQALDALKRWKKAR
jgi:thioredoxin-dependent peroxiredoxin